MRNVDSKKDLLFALKVKGKYDTIYRSDYCDAGQIFLPEDRFCTMDYLKDLLSGRRRYLRNSEARRPSIPRFKQLAMRIVLTHAMNCSHMRKYLPDIDTQKELQLDRHFLFTVVNTLDPNYFPGQLVAIERERQAMQR